MLLVLWFMVVFAFFGRWVTSPASLINYTFNSNANALASDRSSDLKFIDEFWPYRLIQPQWLSERHGELELLLHWSSYELHARLGVCILVTVLLTCFTLHLVKRLISHLNQV